VIISKQSDTFVARQTADWRRLRAVDRLNKQAPLTTALAEYKHQVVRHRHRNPHIDVTMQQLLYGLDSTGYVVI
jgi:hypothetical protein